MAGAKRKKILIVEDETDHVLVLQERLEAYNFEVISAIDGVEGVEKATQEKPDMILLDIIMPRMDGYQACQHLKKDAATKDIPIIILTASGEKDLADRCLELGANAIVRKPYESEELIMRIENMLK